MVKKYRPETRLWGKTKPQARRMRRNPTEAERWMWSMLRNRAFKGFKFRRQHPVGQFIVDFCCPERMLVIELDGGIHRQSPEGDRERERFLEANGFQV